MPATPPLFAQPLAHDSVSSVYACGDAGAPATVDIVLSSLDANDVDVVTF